MTRGSDLIALAGRVLLSAIFLSSGWGKLMNPSGTIQTIAHYHLPVPQLAYAVTLAAELGCGLAILVGFRIRWAALALAAFCFATAFAVHYQPADRMQMINFWKNLAMAGGFLQLVAWGGGRWSLDRR